MFRWIVGKSLKYRFLVIAAAVAMVALGMLELRNTRVDVFPEFAPPLVEIQTEGPGMTAAEVEEMITIPMELHLSGTPGLDVIRSGSVNALSAIRLLFKRGTDILKARQLVQERLELAIADLPKAAGMPLMLQPLSSTSRVMKIGITSKTHDLKDLSMIAYWTIRFRLLSVPGVANIPIWGERIKLLAVNVDPERMRAHDVTLNEIEQAVSDSLDFGLLPYTKHAKTRIDGMLDTPNQRLVIEHVLPTVTPEGVAQVPVKVSNGQTLRMSDVARVEWDTWPMVGDAVINDGPGLMMIVEKLPWANTLEVTRGIEAALAAMKPGLPGIEIDHTIFRPASYIELSIENLSRAMIIGALLVVAVIGIFVLEWRVALISVLAIPLSLVAALLVLYLRETTINVMVLAGLVVALGSVVDDAIIDIENIMRRLRQHRREGSSKSTAAIILDASVEIRSAVVFATLIVVIAVMPVFFMGGLSGAFFEPLATSYILAELASMAVAMTVTPALALMFLRKARLETREPPVVRWLQHRYEAILSRILRAAVPTFATTGAIVALGIGVWPMLGQSLLPDFKERDFLMHWLPLPDSSHPETFRITAAGCRELISIPGVRNCGSHIGRAIGGDEPYGVYFTENWVSVDPKVDYDKTRGAIEDVVEGYPGLVRDVQTYLRERIKEVLTGAGEAIVVRIFGSDLAVLRQKADEVKQAMSGIEGIIDLHTEFIRDIPQIEVKVDLQKAAPLGLKPGDVRRAAATMISGIEVSDIHKDGKVYDVWVWSIPESRKNLTDIRNMMIDTPSGTRVRLADVAEVTLKPSPNTIKRENVSRRIDVHANVRGRDLGAVASDVEGRIQKIAFPIGYYPHILGEYKERRDAQRNMMGAVIVSIIAIILLLHISLGNWRLTSLAFLLLPAALVGGILAAYAGGGIISLGSLVGFLTVLGISARNGILLIDHCRHLERYEGETHGPALVLRAARERLSPILMTSCCTGLALVPLVYWGNIPGHEVEYPLAVVVLGGLLTSTLISLFVIPSLYLRFGAITPDERQPAAPLRNQPLPAA
jgi:CzcA family heavy metal efflux pump